MKVFLSMKFLKDMNHLTNSDYDVILQALCCYKATLENERNRINLLAGINHTEADILTYNCSISKVTALIDKISDECMSMG